LITLDTTETSWKEIEMSLFYVPQDFDSVMEARVYDYVDNYDVRTFEAAMAQDDMPSTIMDDMSYELMTVGQIQRMFDTLPDRYRVPYEDRDDEYGYMSRSEWKLWCIREAVFWTYLEYVPAAVAEHLEDLAYLEG